MQLSAVTLARVIAFIETFDLNPRGRVHFPDLVAALVDRYGFIKFPQKAEDFDETKGVLFDGGKAGNISGVRFQVYTSVIVAESGSSTDDSERILEESLTWAAEKFGLSYNPGMIKRKAYLSQLTFHSDVPLNALNHALSRLAHRLSNRVPQFFGLPVQYETSAIIIGYDPLTLKATPANFTIERRVDVPFSEHKYFSTAPVPTNEHIALLQDFESEIISQAGTPTAAR